MTRVEILEKYKDIACHNLFCYSANYLMSKPKEGYEKEWNEANEEIKLLEELIAEQTE
ncbi:hypothetical protein KQI38_09430 [Tissierella carlieri]|uniref:hypothetical protein n=1 Tax=Tissierella carlieri TaxID=689904 RepID=UPI001C11C102|nr:hypothetical protein [Tissierella carlieri]MBU5312248.1 hypothetical protein [Tissierella carlieri]